MSNFDIFSGMRVYSDPNCLKITNTPVKKHKVRKSMSYSYHKRIQKKWIKRFGYTTEYIAIQTPYGLIVHPEIMKRLAKL